MTVYDGGLQAYTCAHCGAISALKRVSLWAQGEDDGMHGTDWYSSRCAACAGESIWLQDQPETVNGLFMLLNAVVDNQIAQTAAIAEIYDSLPDDKRAWIDTRD